MKRFIAQFIFGVLVFLLFLFLLHKPNKPAAPYEIPILPVTPTEPLNPTDDSFTFCQRTTYRVVLDESFTVLYVEADDMQVGLLSYCFTNGDKITHAYPIHRVRSVRRIAKGEHW